MPQSSGIGMGKLFGISIELHWLSVFFLVFSLLVSVYFFVIILLLLVSILLHEISHSVTAIRNGIKVRKIILILPIGGFSAIDTLGVKPRTEFNIALAGPLSSLLLGSVFGVLVVFAPVGIATQYLQFMFEVNILLGVFNIIPVFPMDGGRMFESYLSLHRSEYDATMLTVKLSTSLIWLILAGTFAFVYVSQASLFYRIYVAVIMIFIAMFLYQGTAAAASLANLKKHTRGINLRHVLTRQFKFVEPDASPSELYSLMRLSRAHVMITKLGEGYGSVSIPYSRLGSVKNAASIAKTIPSFDIKTNAVDAMTMLESSDSSLAAVTSKGRLSGIVTLQNLQAFLSLHVLNKKTAARQA